MSFPCNDLQRTRLWSLPAWTNWSFPCRINNSTKLFQLSGVFPCEHTEQFLSIASIGHAGAFLPHTPCKLLVRCSLPCWILERKNITVQHINSWTWSFPSNIFSDKLDANMELSLRHTILTLEHGAFPPTYGLLNMELSLQSIFWYVWSFP